MPRISKTDSPRQNNLRINPHETQQFFVTAPPFLDMRLLLLLRVAEHPFLHGEKRPQDGPSVCEIKFQFNLSSFQELIMFEY